MTVAQKIALLLGGSLLALIVTGGAGLYQAWSVESGLSQVDERILPRIILIEETAQLFSEQRATFWQYLASSETAARNAAEKRFQDLQVQLFDKLKRYEAFGDGSQQDQALLASDRKEITRYQEFFSMALAWVRQDRLAEARMVIENGEAASQKAAAALAAHVNYNKELNAKRTQETQRANIVQRTVLIGLIVAIVLAVASFGFALYRNVVGGVVRARDMLAHVESALDFTVRAPRQGKDEISQLLDALNRLLDRLQSSMADLNRTTDDVSAAAGSLVDNAASVSQATATQSEAASAMAAAIEEMTVSIGQVSDQTDAAGRVAGQAGQLAQEGAKTVGASLDEIGSVADMVRAAADELSSLQSQSAEIASIVGLIREIAEQTNLLALNAAIEAARAGETGRGFAVVADEVRKLAERTAGATKKISQTMVAMHETANRTTARINESASLVQGSAERATSANAVLQQISSSTREVLGMMDDIAHAIREQREASLNVARQVEVIAQSAETNMASAADAAAQAHGVAGHARQMRATVDLYQIA